MNIMIPVSNDRIPIPPPSSALCGLDSDELLDGINTVTQTMFGEPTSDRKFKEAEFRILWRCSKRKVTFHPGRECVTEGVQGLPEGSSDSANNAGNTNLIPKPVFPDTDHLVVHALTKGGRCVDSWGNVGFGFGLRSRDGSTLSDWQAEFCEMGNCGLAGSTNDNTKDGNTNSYSLSPYTTAIDTGRGRTNNNAPYLRQGQAGAWIFEYRNSTFLRFPEFTDDTGLYVPITA